jgi:NCS1 family nucleobase:cation symporter-1
LVGATLTTPPWGSFNIGYIYSFVAAGLYYWGFNRFFPHRESIMDHAETGEDIIAAQDAKNVEERRASRIERRPSVVTKFFEV